MRTVHRLAVALSAAWCCVVAANAGGWHADLPTAVAAARQADSPVLLHFGATWCPPCRQMEPVLYGPHVAGVLGGEVAGVKLDLDANKGLAQKLGVAGIPADVMTTPDGRVLGVMTGYKPAGDYVRRVRAVASQYAEIRDRTRLARTPPGDPAGARRGPLAPPPRATVTPRDPAPPRRREAPSRIASDPSWEDPPALAAPGGDDDLPSDFEPAETGEAPGGAFGSTGEPDWDIDDDPPAVGRDRAGHDPYGGRPDPFAIPNVRRPQADRDRPADRGTNRPVAPRITAKPARRLLGLKGYCPVTLREDRAWTPGVREFSWPHQGITYFMADADAFAKFVKAAEDYAPRLLGCDPVLYRDAGRAVPGSTRFAAVWRGGLFLFATDANRRTFRASPEKYASSKQVLLIEEIEGVGTF